MLPPVNPQSHPSVFNLFVYCSPRTAYCSQALFGLQPSHLLSRLSTCPRAQVGRRKVTHRLRQLGVRSVCLMPKVTSRAGEARKHSTFRSRKTQTPQQPAASSQQPAFHPCPSLRPPLPFLQTGTQISTRQVRTSLPPICDFPNLPLKKRHLDPDLPSSPTT